MWRIVGAETIDKHHVLGSCDAFHLLSLADKHTVIKGRDVYLATFWALMEGCNIPVIHRLHRVCLPITAVY